MSNSLLTVSLVKNKYEQFNKMLKNRIPQNSLYLYNNECYLINNSWDQEFSNNITNYRNIKNSYDSKNNNLENFLPKNPPKFLDDIDSVIDYLKTNKIFKLISKELINLIYNENVLNNINLVNYYSGYNKIIIEFF